MAYIELIGNQVEIYENNQFDQIVENEGLQTFWSWELKLLRQEQDYFSNHLQNLEAQVQSELENLSQKAAASQEDGIAKMMRAEVEKKFEKKREFLEAGLKRAQFEETIHLK